MDDSRAYFQERAAQCRRLAQSVSDRRACEQLTEMAGEFDAEAKRAGERETLGQLRDGAES
jgi:hypothetical protein